MTDPTINPGARPTAETTEAAAAEHVRVLFNSIAPSYDRLNHLISFGLDRHWWRKTAHTFRATLARPEARILDICCGTGDLTAALLKLRPKPGSPLPQTPGAPPSARGDGSRPESKVGSQDLSKAIEPITGLDFSAEMLNRARTKYPTPNVHWLEGDALHLPFPDSSLDLVTSAFGFRNLSNYAAGLHEIARVLKPGGQIGILEANQPQGLKGALYNLYFHQIMPVIGGALSGDREAYRYLPASVARFPRPPQMLGMLQEAGFANPAWDGYLLDSAGLYRGTRI